MDFLNTVNQEHLTFLKDLSHLSRQYEHECGLTTEVTHCFTKFLLERKNFEFQYKSDFLDHLNK